MQKFTKVAGPAAPMLRANVDTDVIIPIQRLVGTGRDGLGPYAFERLRYNKDGSDNPDFVLYHPQASALACLDKGRIGVASVSLGLARAALDASIKQTVSDDPVSRIGAFLKTQSGMRSLEPKQGDDPDAVLSRAEAAVEAGDLATALTEVTKLPSDGQAAMATWVAAATTRLSVTQAATSLSQTLLAQ